MAWNPERYLAFGAHRLRPAHDLITSCLSAVSATKVSRVIDLGCGPGNITPHLAKAFEGAAIVGVDNSPEMIDAAEGLRVEAEADGNDLAARVSYVLGAAETFAPDADDGGAADILFSNAALHWVPDHTALFPALLANDDLLKPGGLLAVQMPYTRGQASHEGVRPAAARVGAADALANVTIPGGHVQTPETYLELLSEGASSVEVWTTTYLQVLPAPDVASGAHPSPVVGFTSGTTLLPVMEALEGEPGLGEAFLAAYNEDMIAAYPPRADGTTVFPFTRVFMIARKKEA